MISDLYDITNRTIDELYGQNYGPRVKFTMDTISKVYSLESELSIWRQHLPTSLGTLQVHDLDRDYLRTTSHVSRYSRRPQTVITLRYLHARILIHRPVLEGLLEIAHRNLSDREHLQMMRLASANSISVLVSCAVRLISIMHNLVVVIAQGVDQLGAWWFSLYYSTFCPARGPFRPCNKLTF